MKGRVPCAAIAAVGVALCPAAPAQVAASLPAELQRVEIIATSPLPGLGLPLRDVPANVQTFGASDLRRLRAETVARLLADTAGSVSLGDAQGNAYQPDIGFRGFAASPLLGVPQGLSVFQDGVRVNEPFGDVVNWDLLPAIAIARIQLVPGSHPVFGLNTLGGALAITTKNGADDPGGAIVVEAGSFRRRGLEAELGGRAGSESYYLAGHLVHDAGWAEHNASRVAQLFAKLGHKTGAGEVELSASAAHNTLEGRQTLPLSFLDAPTQPYTWPDVNRNELLMVAASGKQRVAEDHVLGAHVYVRRYRNRNLSSNVDPGFGEVEPDTGSVHDTQAHNDRSQVDQTSLGAGLQWTVSAPLAGRRNQFVLGASIDAARSRYAHDTQPASFTPTRGTVGSGEYEPETDAAARQRLWGLWASDTLALSERWTLTASGRLNAAVVRIEDRSGRAPRLDGRHRFARFSPALGVNFNPSPQLTAYASASGGVRMPTAMELTCADADAPCRLPNAFLADPPLAPVTVRTVEVGARGQFAAAQWSIALFRSNLRDDVQFIGSGATNAGYFANVGATRRAGLELGMQGRGGPFELALRLSWLQATYRTGFVEHSPDNVAADARGNIVVAPGQRIAGIPRASLKLRVGLAASANCKVGANLVARGASVARGDENGADPSGPVPGFAVVDADAQCRFGESTTLALNVRNVFDRRYATFGQLGRNAFTGPDRSFDGVNAVREPFRGPGAPRSLLLSWQTEWR